MGRAENFNSQVDSSAPIGLFDSGVGGLTVFREIRHSLPDESLIYLGDSARTPYGTKTASTILGYARECANFLVQRKVKLVVIACNTASSVAFQALKDELPCPVVSVIEPAAQEAVRLSPSGRIGLIGTSATIASNAYSNLIQELRPDAQVFSRACPLFVPMVEEGLFGGAIVDLAVDRYLSSLRSSHIDTLILGCTHYPLLKEAIVSYLGEDVRIIDCGRAASAVVRNLLEERELIAPKGSKPQFGYYVTDTGEQFEKFAAPFLGYDSVKAVRVHRL